MTTAPDFRTELARLVDLYYALGGNWSPHGYTDTWNDALASARAALATLPPEPPADGEVAELVRWMHIVPQGILRQVEGKLRQQQEAQH